MLDVGRGTSEVGMDDGGGAGDGGSATVAVMVTNFVHRGVHS